MIKQYTEEGICKDCGVDFNSKLVFGQMTTRCNECRDKKGFAYRKPRVQVLNTGFGLLEKPCPGTADKVHELNPGGYCYHCQAGGDFS